MKGRSVKDIHKRIEEAIFIQAVNEAFEDSCKTRGYDRRHDFPADWTIPSIATQVGFDLKTKLCKMIG